MSIVDSLSEPVVRKTLNADPGFERLRYLVVLTAATEPPFGITGLPSGGYPTFNINQLSRIAKQLGLEFEKYRGAERVFGQLEKAGLIKAVRNEQTGFHTYYATERGRSETRLNLDRLRKVQELQSQAQTMQMTIRKQLTKPPPTVLEINLGLHEFTIGTDEDNDLMVHDRYMSRRHARVTYAAGTWVLEDLNSRNGCWKIDPNNLERVSQAVIADNDMYQLGSTIVRFKAPQ